MIRSPALLVLLALVAAPAAASAADTVIAEPAISQVVSAHGGRLAWSERDVVTGQDRLMTWFNGVASQVPVAPLQGGFDVDLGRGPDGTTVAVYSRADGLHLFDFAAGTERRLNRLSKAGVREQGPSISGGLIVFFRTATRRGLYTGSLRTGSIRRIPKLPSDIGGYDFQGRRIAYVAGGFEAGADRTLYELYVHDVVSGRRRRVARASSGLLSSVRLLGPTFAGSRLYAAKVRRGAAGNRFLRIDLNAGGTQEARGRADVLEASFTEGRAFYLRAANEDGDCTPCTLALTPRLEFTD